MFPYYQLNRPGKAGCMIHRSAYLIAGLVLILLAATSRAEIPPEKINQIKTAFVYNIAKFVTWPESDDQDSTSLEMCLYQEHFLGSAFDSLDGRTVQKRTVVTRVLSDLSELSGCHVLMIHANRMDQYQKEYSNSREFRGVLTIADLVEEGQSGKIYPGILINLIRKKSKIGFEVNLDEIEEHHLIVNSQLLKLATVLDGGK